MNETHICLYYGSPFFKKKLTFTWKEIESVEPQVLDRKVFASAGIAGGVPVEYRKPVVKINLTHKLPDKSETSIKRQNKFALFREGLQITDDGRGIIVIDEPRNGFDSFLALISEYVTVYDIEDISDFAPASGLPKYS